MEKDYENLKNFWDTEFKSQEAYDAEGKFVSDDRINNIFKKYINQETKVLDFGCGSGWALPEMYYTTKFKEGIGVDQSPAGINVARGIKEKSLPDANITYELVDGFFNDKKEYFDFVFTCNTLDVVPDEVIKEMITNIKASVKKGGHVLVCLNPAFTEEELVNLIKMEKRGSYYFKDGIMRCNYKHVEDWIALFSKDFKVLEYDEFYITETDRFKRRYYLLEK